MHRTIPAQLTISTAQHEIEAINSEMSCTWFISTCCCYAQRRADVARSKQRLYLHSYQIWTLNEIRNN